MFSEAYIIFSLGLIKPLQSALYPTCFKTHTACSAETTHVQNYIQVSSPTTCPPVTGSAVLPRAPEASHSWERQLRIRPAADAVEAAWSERCALGWPGCTLTLSSAVATAAGHFNPAG
eukprot:GHUV01035362.1.p2 GENE.GHUV01035362.1~~GHUV01035362.1.p2  ORF type:complete len:118 (-),score=27.79 GHUV01035362.1:184-537(-)